MFKTYFTHNPLFYFKEEQNYVYFCPLIFLLFYIYFSGEKLLSFVVRDPGFKGKRELADCVNFL